MLPGVSGFRPMPRKMAGIAMITIDASIVAIVMLSVVLDSAIHRYRSGFPPFGRDSPDAPFRCPESSALPHVNPVYRQNTCLMATIYLGRLYLGWLTQTTGCSSPEPGPAEAGVRSKM